MRQLDVPNFLIVGTMKSGTTTLFRWLQEVTASELCIAKEPGFFSNDKNWRRGLGWYLGLFPESGFAGEASTSYTHPDHAAVAARRIAETLPRTKLIVLLRDPEARLRSHYRHEVQRGHERRSFEEATDPGSVYCRQSLYATVLRPYLDLFGEDRLLVLQSERLFGPDLTAWSRLLDFLSLEQAPRPEQVHNVTARKPPYTRVMGRIYGSPIVHRLEGAVPKPVRRMLRPLFISEHDPVAEGLMQESKLAPLRPDTARAVAADVSDLPPSILLDLALWGRTT